MRGKSILSGNKVHQFNLNTLRLDKELEALQVDLLLLPGEIQKRAIVGAQWHTAMDKQVCFPRNTRIETLSGEKSIQDVAKGDLVLSHSGWRKVKQIIKRRYSGKMVKIETCDGRSLIATAEHPVFEIKKGWVEIQELRENDCLKTREDKIINIVRIQNIRFFKSYNLISQFLKFFIFLSIFYRIMPIISISLKTNIKIWKKKINAISLNLKLLYKINMLPCKTMSDMFLNRSFTRILAITGKRTKSFLILLIRTNSKFFFTVSAFNIYRRSSAFLRAIVIRSMITINNFATSLARNICYSREFAFQTTSFISGCIRPGSRESLLTDRTNFSYSLPTEKRLITPIRAESYSSGFNLPRPCIKRFAANFANEIPTSFCRFMIALKRTEFLFGISCRLKFLLTKLASHIDLLRKHFSRFRASCQAFNVYNLEVETAHTYYANGILVHNCPLCNSMQGEIIPVDSPEWGRIAPPIHISCRCMLSFITADERGVIPRLERYKPVDPDLLAKWSSKIYTDVEIGEMVKARMAAGDPLDVSVAHESSIILNKSGKEKLGREYGIFFDKNGKVVLRRRGESNGIYFSKKQLEAVKASKAKVFLHNHPSGGAFSNGDLDLAPYLNVDEMRVVGQKYKYSIRPKPGKKWPEYRDVYNAYAQKESDLGLKYERIYERTKDYKSLHIAESNEIWESISDDLGLIYKRSLR